MNNMKLTMISLFLSPNSPLAYRQNLLLTKNPVPLPSLGYKSVQLKAGQSSSHELVLPFYLEKTVCLN